MRLPCFAHIFIQFPPSYIPYNPYHRETLWSNTKKSGEEIYSLRVVIKEISYIKLERRVLFRREHIDEFLLRNTVQAVPKKELKKIKRKKK